MIFVFVIIFRFGFSTEKCIKTPYNYRIKLRKANYHHFGIMAMDESNWHTFILSKRAHCTIHTRNWWFYPIDDFFLFLFPFFDDNNISTNLFSGTFKCNNFDHNYLIIKIFNLRRNSHKKHTKCRTLYCIFLWLFECISLYMIERISWRWPRDRDKMQIFIHLAGYRWCRFHKKTGDRCWINIDQFFGIKYYCSSHPDKKRRVDVRHISLLCAKKSTVILNS